MIFFKKKIQLHTLHMLTFPQPHNITDKALLRIPPPTHSHNCQAVKSTLRQLGKIINKHIALNKHHGDSTQLTQHPERQNLDDKKEMCFDLAIFFKKKVD